MKKEVTGKLEFTKKIEMIGQARELKKLSP